MRDASGQPVIAAGASWSAIPAEGVAISSSADMELHLRELANLYGTPQQHFAPVKVRNTWVLAPETRQQVNTDLSKAAPEDALGRGALLNLFLVGLSAAEVDRLCSSRGIVVGGLSDRLQRMAARAFRPPLDVSVLTTKRYPASWQTETREDHSILTPPDLQRLRLRAQLRSQAPCLIINRHGSSDPDLMDAFGFAPMYVEGVRQILTDPAAPRRSPNRQEIRLVDLPVISTVPNALKPTDLEGAELTQPFGASGVMSVAEAIQRLGTVTGREFRASTQFSALRVFIGADAIPCGDVVDGLRLALTASIRKIGDIYFLTWDREGLGALQTAALENTVQLADAARVLAETAGGSTTWADIAMKAPFAANDKLAWTAEQRKVLFGPVYLKDGWDPREVYVRWPDLTPQQQGVIRSLASGVKLSLTNPTGEGDWVNHEITEEDLRKYAALQGMAELELSVDLGDGQWVEVADWWWKEFTQRGLDWLRSREHTATTVTPNGAGRYEKEHDLLPAQTRAIMAPLLAPERLASLATQMKSCGIRTLFYPILTDGYATFPSDAFPPHPAIGASNGWLECVNAMKPAGISVVGYMETLTWRRPGETGHWLEKYPELLDRDILGRPFGDAVKAEATRKRQSSPSVTGDLVRAAEPEVERRLKALVDAFLQQPGAAGLCLDAWCTRTAYHGYPFGQSVYTGRTGPMGCSIPDRLASILERSIDPVDVATDEGGFQAPPLADARVPLPFGRANEPRPNPIAPFLTLATHLVPSAGPNGAPWMTFATASTQDYSNSYADRWEVTPPVTMVLGDIRASLPKSVRTGLILRVPNKDERERWYAFGPRVPPSAPAIAAAENGLSHNAGSKPREYVVYDFRGAPEELEDSLARATGF